MKFALMKNICPSCGAPLFSQREEADINAIQNRVVNQEFASKLDETQVYDISLFIFSELTNGIGQLFIQREIEKLPKGTIKEDAEGAEGGEEIDEDLEDIRRKVAQEVGADRLPERVPSSDEDFDDFDELEDATFKRPGEDQDDKVRRLKRLARMNTKKSGPSVKRLG
jgi:hypothetical protein